MEIVDLSQDIYQGMMVYPGHLKTVVFDHATHEETALRFDSEFSFQTKGLMINDNGPTHVDSFSHLDPAPDALTIDQMSLDLFYGTAVCIDVSDVPAQTDITAEHLEAAERAAGVTVESGDILLLHTGTFGRYGSTPRYLTDFPGLGESGSKWIAGRGVKTFGVDSPTPDNPVSRIYPCHLMCREHGITHYENLANLDRLIGRRFTFAGFPLKLIGGHGGPTRAVALLDSEN
ncbi:MAG: Kynurenine formamidase [Amycolatopsis sp.]|jgi:kynurenine formamidase|uniref:cyclase family protein n=1 Tax=Amycolatopsis sp. TaxID=37632 RepID=UPI002603C8BC|nr:cyclase family protein [Amycolatopsis sp.]MCU1687399.1 Kynurenine formamidase [Amycolatopsis sp.]